MLLQSQAEARQAYFDEEQKRLERALTAQLNQENLSAVQRAAIQNKYAKQQADLKRKEFEANKQAQITQAFIGGSLAIVQSLANTTLPFPASLIGPVVIAATTAAQIAAIEAKPIPQFATGVINFQGKGTGTSDDNLVKISHGESIIKADATAKYADILEQINNGSFKMPDVSMNDISTTYVTPQGIVIDYKQIGKEVANGLRSNPQTVVEIDKRGVRTYFMSENSRNETLNNRVSSR